MPEEKLAFKTLGLSLLRSLIAFFIVSLVKTTSVIINASIRSIKFLSSQVALCLYKSIFWSSMEDCCHILR